MSAASRSPRSAIARARRLRRIIADFGAIWRQAWLDLRSELRHLNQIGLDEQLHGANRPARSAAVRAAIADLWRDRGACC